MSSLAKYRHKSKAETDKTEFLRNQTKIGTPSQTFVINGNWQRVRKNEKNGKNKENKGSAVRRRNNKIFFFRQSIAPPSITNSWNVKCGYSKLIVELNWIITASRKKKVFIASWHLDHAKKGGDNKTINHRNRLLDFRRTYVNFYKISFDRGAFAFTNQFSLCIVDLFIWIWLRGQVYYKPL